jgi:hypothetical protein
MTPRAGLPSSRWPTSSVETRNKIPHGVAPRWNETKKETVFVRYQWCETKEQDAVGGARLTIEIAAEFLIGPKSAVRALSCAAACFDCLKPHEVGGEKPSG